MVDVTPQTAMKGPDLGHLTQGRSIAAIMGVIWTCLNVFIATALAMVVFTITSRLLSPTDFGAVALAASVVALLATVIPTAFGEALIQRKDLTPAHLDSVFWLTTGLALVSYGALLLTTPLIADRMSTPILRAILPVLGLRLILDALQTVPYALVQRRMEFRWATIRTACANGLGAILCLGMVLAHASLWALIASQVITALTSLVVIVFAAGWRPTWQFNRKSLRELGHFGLYAMGGKVLNEARLDQLLIGAVLGQANLGLYYFAQRIAQMMTDMSVGVFGPASNVLFASLQGDAEKRREAYLSACFAATSVGFPIFGAMFAMADTLLPLLFGAHWSGAIISLQCLSLIGMMASLGIMQAALIRNLGGVGWWFWYQSVGMVLNLILIVVLARYGLDVILEATVLRVVLVWPVSIRKAQQLIGLPFRTYLAAVAAPALSTAAAMAVVLALPALWPAGTGWSLILAQLAVGGLIQVAGMLAFGRSRLRAILRLIMNRRAVSP
jgi:teichuronic acid exporter